MDNDIKTGSQFSLHILVRGLPLGEGAMFDIAGSRAVVTGIAQHHSALKRFPDAEIEGGDLEAVVWCDAAKIAALMSALTTDTRVVAVEARVESPDSGPPSAE